MKKILFFAAMAMIAFFAFAENGYEEPLSIGMQVTVWILFILLIVVLTSPIWGLIWYIVWKIRKKRKQKEWEKEYKEWAQQPIFQQKKRKSSSQKAEQSISITSKPDAFIDKTIGLVTCMDFAVKGLSYRNSDTWKEARELMVGDELYLEPEPNNKFDENAIIVKTQQGTNIGYVESRRCKRVLWALSTSERIYCGVLRVTDDEIPFVYAILYFKTDTEKLNQHQKEEKERSDREFEKQRIAYNLEKERQKQEAKRQKEEAKPKVVYVDYNQRISHVKTNIARSKKSIEKHKESGNITKMNNSIANLERHQKELAELEQLKAERENQYPQN